MIVAVVSKARLARQLIMPIVCGGVLAASASAADPGGDRVFADAFEVPPVADFTSNSLGFEVTFADQSADSAGTIGAWTWDFGDGSTSTDQNPVHTFAGAGSYTVSETVTDGVNGESGVTSKSVTVEPCGTLTSTLHDFKFASEVGGHPDFERFTCGVTTGLVTSSITPGGLPSFGPNGSSCLSGPTYFAQWYTDDPINYPIQQTLVLSEVAPGSYSYSNLLYFPIDGEGFGNDTATGDDFQPHNFSFTTMLHTQFRYNGGESIHFTGDDDFWLFVNGHLAIDLGGIHAAAEGSVTFTPPEAAILGLSLGQIYRVDIFQAERHTTGSHFSLNTTACLSDAH